MIIDFNKSLNLIISIGLIRIFFYLEIIKEKNFTSTKVVTRH